MRALAFAPYPDRTAFAIDPQQITAHRRAPDLGIEGTVTPHAHIAVIGLAPDLAVRHIEQRCVIADHARAFDPHRDDIDIAIIVAGHDAHFFTGQLGCALGLRGCLVGARSVLGCGFGNPRSSVARRGILLGYRLVLRSGTRQTGQAQAEAGQAGQVEAEAVALDGFDIFPLDNDDIARLAGRGEPLCAGVEAGKAGLNVVNCPAGDNVVDRIGLEGQGAGSDEGKGCDGHAEAGKSGDR